MADQKISAMPNASALTGTEQVPLVQSGANVKSTPDAINALVTNHGSFYSLNDQSVVANTATVITTEHTAFAQEISCVDDSKFPFNKPVFTTCNSVSNWQTPARRFRQPVSGFA